MDETERLVCDMTTTAQQIEEIARHCNSAIEKMWQIGVEVDTKFSSTVSRRFMSNFADDREKFDCFTKTLFTYAENMRMMADAYQPTPRKVFNPRDFT